MGESAAILNELMDPLGACLTPDVAKQLIELRASPKLDARIQELGRRCNEGLLSPQEHSDYETIVRYIKFISVLQSKARTLLQQSATDG